MSFFLNRKAKGKGAGAKSGRQAQAQPSGQLDGRAVLQTLKRRRTPAVHAAMPSGTAVGADAGKPAVKAQPNRRAGASARDKRSGSLAGQAQAPSGRNTRVSRQPQAPAGAAAEAAAPEAKARPARPPRDFSKAVRLARGAGTGLLGLALLALFFAGVFKGSLWLYGEALTSPFFTTRHIDVSGNTRMTKAMVEELGGIREGENTFAVTISEVERSLLSTPWVEDVSVKRLLPDRFVIKVKERMPSFWVRREGRLYYANERGELIAPVEGDNFMALPMLTIEPGGEDAIPYLARLMKDMKSGVLPVEAGAIATVDVSPGRGVEIYLEDREMRLSLAPDDWEGNLSRLGVTIGDLARRRELGKVQEVRAADGCVWVSLRG